MDFGNLQEGDTFKMSEKALLSYTKTNKTDAKCANYTFAIQLGQDHKIYPQDVKP